MLSAKDIIEMEESVIHPHEPRKRSDTLHSDMISGSPTLFDSNPALVSRRASVPMEIIIGGNGKPIFSATPSSNVASPVLAERKSHSEKEKKKSDSRSGSKKRSTSQKKKTVTKTTSKTLTTKKKEIVDRERENLSSEDSPTSLISSSLATCSIGNPTSNASKQISNLPEYEILRKELLVTVRDAVNQTDLF